MLTKDYTKKKSWIEIINAITEKINCFGGTMIVFPLDKFSLGNDLFVYHIFYDKVRFYCEDSNTYIDIALNRFSESYLYALYISYMNECKFQLTDKAYKEIEKYLEEKFA